MCKTLLILTIILTTASIGNTQSSYRYETMFVYNFTKYIEWPGSQTDSFVIGIVGDDGVFEKFKAFFAGRSKSGKAISVQKITGSSESGKCDIIYLAKGSGANMKDFSAAAVQNSALLITEKPGSIASGSMINLILVDGKIKFELSEETTKKANLKISGELLRLAILS